MSSSPAPDTPRRPSWEEADRLAALLRYDILDTPREQDFDDIVRIASQVCGVPVALVSLVTEDRQWFKASLGMPVRETPRDLAFCAHALGATDLLVVSDATQDPRFRGNPLVTAEGGIRFYAGAPLTTPDGFPLGTVCVIDTVPRELTEVQAGTLRALARQVVAQMEMRRLLKEAREHERLMDRAREVQQTLMEELAHRTQNTLAMVQALAHQTLSRAASLEEARRAFSGRLQALGKANATLLQRSWQTAGLAEVARAALAFCDPHQAGQIVLEGDEVLLGERAAMALSLAFHEMATNAMKYGALSVPSGRVSIAWGLSGAAPDRRLHLSWTERDGPAVCPPGRIGFGTRLIKNHLEGAIRGSVTLTYAAAGFGFALSAPLTAASPSLD